ncbi:MAG: hypothetical protein LBO64_01485 [Desulfovibrio sp.]|jgi:2,3-bisphosphoglycerate-independent phosphoglycerate mutase|nr:hypothetical protein [Desulfovibrio sp.]
MSGRGGRNLAEAVRKAYSRGETDYKMEPLVLVDGGDRPVGKIRDGDSVIFCCRRGEREIELTDAFTAERFPYFERAGFKNLNFVLLTLYHEKYAEMPVAFAPVKVKDTLAACVSGAGLKQLHVAESEKFAHVTFFFNGGDSSPIPGEDDVKIPSPRGIPFEEVPELSLPQVAGEVKKGIAAGYDFILVNFANGDVIGHTANTEAKIKCAESVSRYLGEIAEEAKKRGYVIAVTADHGNLEILCTGQGKPHVAHTTAPVPFVLVDPEADSKVIIADNGILADVAPTVLHILDIPKPAAMSGTSIVHNNFAGGRRVLLVILDGWGLGAEDDSNPIFTARTPAWDSIREQNPHTSLRASGGAVGLQEGKPGNSEAGHLNMGAGRIITQDDVRLDGSMKDGSFEKNEVFMNTVKACAEQGSALHLLALLTKKSSHGSIDYPLALLRMAKEQGLEDVFVHLIFDGRSTEPGSAPDLVMELEAEMEKIGAGRIVDGVGRGMALDRDQNWEKIKKVYDALVSGKGARYS